jgi:uncharacterized protein YwgA
MVKAPVSDLFESPAVTTLRKGRRADADTLNPDSVVLMEVLRELGQQPFANPVGRTIFQKICYVITEMGVPTGFRFGKGSYGQLSQDVYRALHVFANRNWVHEAQRDRMMALQVSEQYERDRVALIEPIDRYRKNIDKAVDLFSRIKSTEQAEEVLTVLFASRELKQSRPNEAVNEQQLYDHILEWKKSWRTEEKQRAIASAIRNLVLLEWVCLSPSESLVADEMAAEAA